ncbi:type II toxin-antitoxin system HipA family toxin [Fluviicola taffensis]|uniref:HipA domain protein n=1 Tax=Fluviicola taffensis (strain DSM 16823 / NCIMB 13979 / RW262) TaxID=755732 RepID=F2ICY3_FLUTR|nr:type II toxin-antitoxin system HipA family toxin [Fluviicola taffensis]AEA43357.1 HipA domain protein [Fluviicola taffensis DSM 16823]
MINNAFVNIWNKRVGAIAWDPETGLGTFQYDSTFLKTGLDLSPILMPISQGENLCQFTENRENSTFKGLPGLLADILPDKYGNALINTWLARQGRPTNSLNPVETLCFIGERGMGALEFEPVQPKPKNTSTKIELGSLIEIAEEILTGRKDFTTNLTEDEEKALFEILKIGSSAGGARAKALIAYNENSGEVRSGQASVPKGFEHWLIKFDGVSDSQFGVSKGYGRVEMAYYKMAKDSGIQMMECRLLEENERAHFMTKRFDREHGRGKIHVQTFCAMRHYDFNEVNLYSYEELFETMRMLGLSYPSAQELFRRMVFNVISRNCDDHTKNFAFVMDKSGDWKLSPAYDVCHAYRPGSDWVSQHALSINGKRKNITRQDLLAVSKSMNIKNAEEIIDKVSNVVSNWKDYADDVKVDTELRDSIGITHLIL